MQTRQADDGGLRRIEMIRELLQFSTAEFSRALGLSRQSYARILREGRVPRLVKMAARGLAARRNLQFDQSFLVRVVDGLASVVLLRQLRTTTIEGRVYLLLPLADASEPQLELPAMAGDGTRHPRRHAQHIIDRVIELLHEQPRGLRSAELLDRLETEGNWFGGADRRSQRLQYLTNMLWHESRRADGRVRHAAERGRYLAADNPQAH